MISKILITLGVILACMMVLSARNKPELKTIPNPEAERNKKAMRLTAFAFMGIMVVAAGAMIYLELDKGRDVVTVHVINTQSGAKKSDRRKKTDVRSDGFTTLEGLQVFVAGIERIEIDAPE